MQSFRPQSKLPYKHSELTQKIIEVFYAVYNTLGYGFLEKVYENALCIELIRRGFQVEQQKPIKVRYGDEVVGEYFADLVIDDLILLEIKAVKTFLPEHEAQLLNYLKATSYEVGLLLNFGPQPQQKRRSYENNRKEWWLQQASQNADHNPS
jgi:GxxExxY protein